MRRILIVAALVGLSTLTGLSTLLSGSDHMAQAGYYGYGYGYRRPVARAVARGTARVVVGAPVYHPYGYYGYRPYYGGYYGYGPGYGGWYGPGVGVGVGVY